MAWKGRGTEDQFNYKALQSSLVNSKVQQTNNPLYQTIKGLIDGAQLFKDGLLNAFNKKTDKIILDEQVQGILPPLYGGIDSNSYFPEITDIANITGSDAFYTQFLQTKRLVYVSGKLNLQPTAANVLTEVEIDLPIHSKFETADQLQGVINGIPLGGATEGFAGIVTGNVSNGQARISFYPQNTDNHDCRFIISYELV